MYSALAPGSSRQGTIAHLSLSLLEPLQLTLDGQPVTGFKSNKVRALLAHLAVEAHGQHRDSCSQRHVAGSLKGLTHEIRKRPKRCSKSYRMREEKSERVDCIGF
jgi:hypothetical protein